MPALFILFFVFGIIAIGWFAASPFFGRTAVSNNDRVTLANRVSAGAVMAIALLFLLLSSVKFVGTQDIGVVTSFGHPTGAMSNGVHWKAPWDKVTVLDGKVQTDTYASNGFDGTTQNNAQGGCINVRIARQATACVNVSIRWQNNKGGIDYLFRNYHDNDNIRNNVIHRDLQSAVNIAFAKYDPLGLNASGDSTQPSNTDLGATVLSEMRDQPLGGGTLSKYLDIQSIYIPLFNFDPDTQKRLNGLQQQVAQTRIAQQAEQTARAQSAANKALQASVSNDPNVLVSKCLDILSEAVQKDQALPAGFSCFGGTNTAIAVK